MTMSMKTAPSSLILTMTAAILIIIASMLIHSCNAQVVPPEDQLALLAIISSVSGLPADWVDGDVANACGWEGIVCDGVSGEVREW